MRVMLCSQPSPLMVKLKHNLIGKMISCQFLSLSSGVGSCLPRKVESFSIHSTEYVSRARRDIHTHMIRVYP